MIFVNTTPGWCTSDKCLWCDAPEIRDRFAIQALYPELEDFFVGTLRIPRLTLSMAYTALIESTTVDDVKKSIWDFNALLDTENVTDDQRQQILDSKVFPVMHPPGKQEPTLEVYSTTFAIIDDEKLGDAFSQDAKMLDFTPGEVLKLRPFFAWLGIEHRYLSSLVEQSICGVHEAKVSRKLQSDFRKRAYSLVRLVVSFSYFLAAPLTYIPQHCLPLRQSPDEFTCRWRFALL